MATLGQTVSSAEATEGLAFFIVILENDSLSRSLKQPFMQSLARRGSLFTDYHAITAPSQANYWALTAGTTYGIRSNADINLPGHSLFDLLDHASVSWKVYLENYPGQCFEGPYSTCVPSSPIGGLLGAGCATGPWYARKHNPAISFDSIRQDPSRCARLVPATQLQADVLTGQVPQFAFYVPNQLNDGHDTDTRYTDDYLLQTWAPLLRDPAFVHNRVVIFTYDEDASGENVPFEREAFGQRGRILTLMLGPNVKSGQTLPTRYTHYDLLRTIEEYLSLGHLGQHDALPTTRRMEGWLQTGASSRTNGGGQQTQDFVQAMEGAVIEALATTAATHRTPNIPATAGTGPTYQAIGELVAAGSAWSTVPFGETQATQSGLASRSSSSTPSRRWIWTLLAFVLIVGALIFLWWWFFKRGK